MAEWLQRRRRRITPKDELAYIVPREIVDFTTRVLQEYGRQRPAAEGVVYWAGRRRKNEWYICAAVAPAVQASRYGFQTGYDTNARFVSFLCENDLQYLSQVHSHPSIWVDHSLVDDQETAFRREGLLSIVVPSFGASGIFPLQKSGVHLFQNSRFQRLTDKYLKGHFRLVETVPYSINLRDFRYE
jgi:hypothetical protein